jgi:hypothetical protein
VVYFTLTVIPCETIIALTLAVTIAYAVADDRNDSLWMAAGQKKNSKKKEKKKTETRPLPLSFVFVSFFLPLFLSSPLF